MNSLSVLFFPVIDAGSREIGSLLDLTRLRLSGPRKNDSAQETLFLIADDDRIFPKRSRAEKGRYVRDGPRSGNGVHGRTDARRIARNLDFGLLSVRFWEDARLERSLRLVYRRNARFGRCRTVTEGGDG